MTRIGPLTERVGRLEGRAADNWRLIDQLTGQVADLAAAVAAITTQMVAVTGLVTAHQADTKRHTGR